MRTERAGKLKPTTTTRKLPPSPLLVVSVSALATSLMAGGIQFDLSSSDASISLGSQLFHTVSSVAIAVGGVQRSFHAGSLVTAGEFVAIQEVLGGLAQTVSLNDHGGASGGSFSLNAADAVSRRDIVIADGISAIDYLSKSGSISITGDLTNYFSLYGVSAATRVRSGSIIAQNITSDAGALISTQIPDLLVTGLASANVSVTLDGSLTPVKKTQADFL